MKLLPSQTDETSLSAFGQEAQVLLVRRDYAALASRFGYARANGRPLAAALEADFLNAASSPITVGSGEYLPLAITVTYFTPNATGLFAVIECPVSIAENSGVLLELIVTEKGEDRYITVEDISGVAK